MLPSLVASAAALPAVAATAVVEELGSVDPQSAPRKLDGAYCKAKLADSSHLFRRMWSADGWGTSGPGRAPFQKLDAGLCWDKKAGSGSQWFDQVLSRSNCKKRNWIEMIEQKAQPARQQRRMLMKEMRELDSVNTAILGFDDDIWKMCRSHLETKSKKTLDRMAADTELQAAYTDAKFNFDNVLENGDPRVMCPLAGFNMLHVDPWTMCDNFEWQVCAVTGSLAMQDPVNASAHSVTFATPPSSLDPSGASGGKPLDQCVGSVATPEPVGSPGWTPSTLDDGVYGYTNVDIYYLEVCTLHAICDNGDDLFKLSAGEKFRCQFSPARFRELQSQLLTPPTARPEGEPWCVKEDNPGEVEVTGFSQPVYYTPGRLNVVTEGIAGQFGGSCTCPDGATYLVGTYNVGAGCDDSLACDGGTPGKCVASSGAWSGRKVACGSIEGGMPSSSAARAEGQEAASLEDVALEASGQTPQWTVPALPPQSSASSFGAFPKWGGTQVGPLGGKGAVPFYLMADFEKQCSGRDERQGQKVSAGLQGKKRRGSACRRHLLRLPACSSRSSLKCSLTYSPVTLPLTPFPPFPPLPPSLPPPLPLSLSPSPALQSWLDGISQGRPDDEMVSYLGDVYGRTAAGLKNVRPAAMSFFYNSVPGRDWFRATWSTVRCSVLGLIEEGQLFAPVDDAQHNPRLLTPAMLERCNRPECSQNQDCLQVPLRALRQDEVLAQVTAMRTRPGSRMGRLVTSSSSGMRTCLARGLESFANFSMGANFADGHSSIALGGYSFQLDLRTGRGVQTAALPPSSGYPSLEYTFPGFFVAHPRDRLFGDADTHERISRKSGLPAHTWVEVMRIARIDDKVEAWGQKADRSTVGQVWFWLSPGSGVWWNTGRTVVINTSVVAAADGALNERSCASPFNLGEWWQKRDEEFRWATCESVRKKGYDTMQLTNSFCGFSWELIDCRGSDRADAKQTWTSACPPPHVKLMRGLPTPRAAPALRMARGPAAACMCSSEHDHINCDANTQPLAPPSQQQAQDPQAPVPGADGGIRGNGKGMASEHGQFILPDLEKAMREAQAAQALNAARVLSSTSSAAAPCPAAVHEGHVSAMSTISADCFRRLPHVMTSAQIAAVKREQLEEEDEDEDEESGRLLNAGSHARQAKGSAGQGGHHHAIGRRKTTDPDVRKGVQRIDGASPLDAATAAKERRLEARHRALLEEHQHAAKPALVRRSDSEHEASASSNPGNANDGATYSAPASMLGSSPSAPASPSATSSSSSSSTSAADVVAADGREGGIDDGGIYVPYRAMDGGAMRRRPAQPPAAWAGQLERVVRAPGAGVALEGEEEAEGDVQAAGEEEEERAHVLADAETEAKSEADAGADESDDETTEGESDEDNLKVVRLWVGKLQTEAASLTAGAGKSKKKPRAAASALQPAPQLSDIYIDKDEVAAMSLSAPRGASALSLAPSSPTLVSASDPDFPQAAEDELRGIVSDAANGNEIDVGGSMRRLYEKYSFDTAYGVNADQLYKVLRDLALPNPDEGYVTRDRMGSLVKTYDMNRSGALEFDEFVKLIKGSREYLAKLEGRSL